MGLFDFKYKKRYEANTLLFQNRLVSLQELAIQNDMGREANIIITQIQYWLGETAEYPNGDKNSIIAIDNRISGLLDDMNKDIQDQSSDGFMAHARMMLEAVQSSRKFGKERESSEYYIQSKLCAEFLAKITNNNRKIQRFKQRMLQIEKEAETMDETDVKFSDLDAEYIRCEEVITNLERERQAYIMEYMNSKKLLEKMLPEVFRGREPYSRPVCTDLDLKSIQEITNRLTAKALERGRVKEGVGTADIIISHDDMSDTTEEKCEYNKTDRKE